MATRASRAAAPSWRRASMDRRIGRNRLISIARFPRSLRSTSCGNRLISIARFPRSLRSDFLRNRLISIARFPRSLRSTSCGNRLISIARFPRSLRSTSCGNRLISIARFPRSLRSTSCGNRALARRPMARATSKRTMRSPDSARSTSTLSKRGAGSAAMARASTTCPATSPLARASSSTSASLFSMRPLRTRLTMAVARTSGTGSSMRWRRRSASGSTAVRGAQGCRANFWLGVIEKAHGDRHHVAALTLHHEIERAQDDGAGRVIEDPARVSGCAVFAGPGLPSRRGPGRPCCC